MEISGDRKKELRDNYKQMKPAMGLFAVINKKENKYLLIATQQINGTRNSCEFQLKFGSHRDKTLQKDWDEREDGQFEITVLEELKYDEKAPEKTDYNEELNILKMVWQERLEKEGASFYQGK